MPKYTLKWEQWMQEVCEITVDASDPRAAFNEGLRLFEEGDVDPEWSDGVTATDPRIMEVRDLTGFLVLTDSDISDLYIDLADTGVPAGWENNT